jgi:thymidine kinase
MAEEVTKLTSICVKCGVEASFTQRTIESSEITVIGSHEAYIPVCRKCFYTRSKKNSPIMSKNNSTEDENSPATKMLTIEHTDF